MAVRGLPSGDTIVTFLGQESKEWHTENPAWAIVAFGPTAEVQRRTYAVVAKRLCTEDLRGVTPVALAKEIVEENRMKVSRAHVRLPKSSSAWYAALLVEVYSVDNTNLRCERGMVWDAQIYQCEPFSGDLRPRSATNAGVWAHGKVVS
jgi:hypothetical protein